MLRVSLRSASFARFFIVKRWIMDPEVDSRPALFVCVVLGSTADTCSASVYGVFHIRELVDYGSSGRFSTCSFFSVCLVQQWIQVSASVYVAGLPGHDAPRAVFLRCPQAPDARHHGRYGPEGQFYARFLVALRCRVVVKVSLLVVLEVMHGTALCR